MTAERELWGAVLLKAAIDATAVDPSGEENRKAKREADAWFRGRSRDFAMVCNLAGMDPAFIHEAYVSGRMDAGLLRAAARADT